jgi:hypothetical protein
MAVCVPLHQFPCTPTLKQANHLRLQEHPRSPARACILDICTCLVRRCRVCGCCVLQGYTKLLSVLGSNVAEFLQNLNNLHLHLVYCWPDMVPPAFRCEQVWPSSIFTGRAFVGMCNS